MGMTEIQSLEVNNVTQEWHASFRRVSRHDMRRQEKNIIVSDTPKFQTFQLHLFSVWYGGGVFYLACAFGGAVGVALSFYCRKQYGGASVNAADLTGALWQTFLVRL